MTKEQRKERLRERNSQILKDYDTMTASEIAKKYGLKKRYIETLIYEMRKGLK